MGATTVALTGCGRFIQRVGSDPLPAQLTAPTGKVSREVRLLDRAGFGPRPGDVEDVLKRGIEAWVTDQLQPSDQEPPALSLQLSRLEATRMDGMELRDLPEDEVLRQLAQAQILRQIYSPWQVRERMVDLWTNHFNVYGRKGLAAWRKVNDDVQVIRRHALGNFPELLRANAHSAAMLAYLDNRQNLRGAPNENYARELMELHSLGVDGGYTQKDVQEVARCFTGWTVEDRFLHHGGAFRFNPELHDDGEKTVLGVRIPAGGGQSDGDRVLDIITKHPSCARFVSMKLCRAFLGDANSPMVDRLIKIFGDTGGEIKPMLKELFLSKEFLEGAPIAKRPLDYVVSAMRASHANTDARIPIQQWLTKMGQPLFEWPMPDGYPDRASSWTGSMLARWNFAHALCNGGLPDSEVPFEQWEKRAEGRSMAKLFADSILVGRDRDRYLAACDGKSTQAALALALSTPEFQWR